MPISRRTKRILLITSTLALLIGGLILAVIPILLERWLNQYDLESAFHEATGGAISTGTLKLRVFPAPHLIIPSGKLELPDLVDGRWQEIRIHPAYKSILSGRIRFHKLKVIAPDVQLKAALVSETEGSAETAMGHLTAMHLHQMQTAAFRKLGNALQWLVSHAPQARVQVRQGRLHLTQTPLLPAFSFHDIDARLILPPDALEIDLDCKSSLFRTLRVAGVVDAGSLAGQLTLWFNRLDAERLSGITGLDRALDRIDGFLSGHMTVDLMGPSKIESQLSFRLPNLVLQRLEAPLTVQNAFIDGNVRLDETTFRFDLNRLYTAQPRLDLTGHFQMGGDLSGLRLHLVGSQIDVAQAREATLALVGDSPSAVKIFDVLRAGHVPWISWRTEGRQLGDLSVFRNMKLTGEMQNGELYIPAVDLQLTDVNGIADIADEVLRGEGLSARETTTRGRNGKLWLDFEPDEIPFFLEIDTHLHDVGRLPPRLIEWVDNIAFQNELRRLSEVRGEARGIMILDSRKGEGLEVTADVAQCQLALNYDRLPWEISIDKGLVLYTNDRVALDQMSGRIGSSTFRDLKARVDLEGETWLQIDSTRAVVDLETVMPWLMSQKALASAAGPYRVSGGSATIASLSLQGPFGTPSRWSFKTRAQIDQLTVAADTLPGPLNFSNLQLRADEHSLNAQKAELKVLDAKVTGSARTAFAAGRLRAYDLAFKGTLGRKTDKWINDLFEEEADFYLTQAPVTLSEARVRWARSKPFSGFADFTTSKGVRVLLSQEIEPKAYRKERAEIHDDEAVAIISLDRQPGQLDFGFEGKLTAKTLDRLLLRNPFPSGRLRGDFQMTLVPEAPERSTARGHLTAANIRLPLDIDHKIHLSQLQLSAEDKQLKIAPAAFLVDGNWHTLEGGIGLASKRYHVDLVHEGAYFNLPTSDEPQSDDESEDGSSQLERLLGLPIDGKIHSRLSALKWGEQQWVPLQTTTVMTPGQWVVELDEAGLCGINTTGTVVLTKDNVSVDLKHEARDRQLSPALSCLLGKPDLIDGRFKFKGRLKGSGSPETLKQSLEGRFRLNAKDGRIYRFDLLGRILAAINLTELVRGKKSDLMGEGLAYRKIEIEARLKDRQLALEKALIDGASAEIAAKGTLDLEEDEIDLLVMVAPLKTVDALVKFTPVINTWLEGTLVSIPVKISGQKDDPRITPLAPTAVGSSLWNLLKNTVQLPIKLVEPLFEDEDEEENEGKESPSP